MHTRKRILLTFVNISFKGTRHTNRLNIDSNRLLALNSLDRLLSSTP